MSFPLPAACAEILKGRIVFCGFSGGSDSLYLLLALKMISAPFHFQLRAVHFNHGLRGGESEADEAWCREKCRKENLPFLSIRLHLDSAVGEGGLEAAARNARLTEWKRLIRENPSSVVALGHQAEDRRENLLLRLMRGSNVSGLTSLRLCSEVEGIRFVRPLLAYSKEEMERRLRDAGEVWRTDSSNASDFCGRNFLRLTLIPSLLNRFPYAAGGLRRSLEVLEEDADYLEREARRAFGTDERMTPAQWSSLHPAIRCRVLRLFLEKSGISVLPDSALLERFAEAVSHPPENGESRRIPLAGNPDCFLTVERDTVSLQHREMPCEPVEWELERMPICRFGEFLLQAERVKRTDETLDLQNRDPMTVFFSLDLPRKLIVSPRRDGDRMIPFGKHHALLVKKLCSEGGIKAYSRNSHPLLRTEEGEILWFPGVRRSASYPVAESAREMWRIRARRTPPEREAMTRKKD